MNPASTTPSDLAGMVTQLHRLLDDRPDCPTPDEIREACNVLYSASLLKEEGRPVRARVILAPPDAFAAADAGLRKGEGGGRGRGGREGPRSGKNGNVAFCWPPCLSPSPFLSLPLSPLRSASRCTAP